MKDRILSYFEALSRLPRPSGHEERAAAFVLDWAKTRGYTASGDRWHNVTVDIDATPGFEGAPVTILQSHLDMVCVAEAGRDFDPLRDAPVLRYETVEGESLLRAEGTSLGADDGVGVAVMLAAAEAPVHGPLRLIATAD